MVECKSGVPVLTFVFCRGATEANVKFSTLVGASSPATMPLLADNRKDTGGKSIGATAPGAANPASRRWQYGGIVTNTIARSRNRGLPGLTCPIHFAPIQIC